MIQKLAGYMKYLQASHGLAKVAPAEAQAFAREVFDRQKSYYAFGPIEQIREQWLRDDTTFDMQDYGAGSKKMKGSQRKISQVAKSSLSTPEQCRALFQAVDYLQPDTIVELGSSLGISAAYMAAARPSAHVHTIEGDPTIAAHARRTFDQLGLSHVMLYQQTFDEALADLLPTLDGIDIAYIDGHHTFEATIAYTKILLPKMRPNGLLIYDDIYWSAEMEQAWSSLKALSPIRYTIDVYAQGYVFLGNGFASPRHNVLRLLK